MPWARKAAITRRLIGTCFIGVAIICYLVLGPHLHLCERAHARHLLPIVIVFLNNLIIDLRMSELLNTGTGRRRLNCVSATPLIIGEIVAWRVLTVLKLVSHPLLRESDLPDWHSARTLTLQLIALI